jgi:hypothetical protein
MHLFGEPVGSVVGAVGVFCMRNIRYLISEHEHFLLQIIGLRPKKGPNMKYAIIYFKMVVFFLIKKM